MTTRTGININLVSKDKLIAMSPTEKLRFILDEVRGGKVLVLERGLTPTEEAKLIEATMAEIDQNTFIGIEMQSYGAEKQSKFQKLMNGAKAARPRMAVIGPRSEEHTSELQSQSNLVCRLL